MPWKRWVLRRDPPKQMSVKLNSTLGWFLSKPLASVMMVRFPWEQQNCPCTCVGERHYSQDWGKPRLLSGCWKTSGQVPQFPRLVEGMLMPTLPPPWSL